MTPNKIVNREDWLTARRALLVQEKAHTRANDAITRARQSLPWVRVEKDYRFDSADGEVALAELFNGHSQLIVFHFMFGPEWDAGCVSCSFWADSYNGLAPHLAARDIGFVAVSRAPMAKIAPFKKRMNWGFNWVSSANSTFNFDFDASFGPDRPEGARLMFNFQEIESAPMDEVHGVSVFIKDDQGEIFHTYSTYRRGVDIANAAYNFIDLTPKGRDEPTSGTMNWVRHHDAY